ncbi:RNA polymerase sigma factor [Actinomadura sp. SCN-SB]|uniref:RNA polymerase sigma factor n=1 Tax=Actinomadura sp. SCN-SB TaxID=3373092 RepID=UPI0037506360
MSSDDDGPGHVRLCDDPPGTGRDDAESDEVAEAVKRAGDGDGTAWAWLVDRYSGLLWSIARAYGLSQADAGDVVQTTWLRLVERIDRIERPGSVGTWLAVTARRESLHASRRAAARGAALDDAVVSASGGVAPEDVALARERVGEVAEALAALPRRCQVLLRLCATAPSYAELATALGMPVGSIGPTRARCLNGLLRRLDS